MLDWARERVHAILRVPPEPAVPDGTAGSAMVFRAARNFYRWRVCGWIVAHLGIAAGILASFHIVGLAAERWPLWGQYLFTGLEILAVLALLSGLPFSYLALALDYRLRWYIVTDRSLRVRQGVWNVSELTMTFANIQEIRVSSGPLQKLLGIADVEVKAAGGGAAGPHGQTGGHSATFEGVDNAEVIRDLIVERLREYRDTGLGGAESRPTPSAAPNAEVLAARAVLEEAKALRNALGGGSAIN